MMTARQFEDILSEALEDWRGNQADDIAEGATTEEGFSLPSEIRTYGEDMQKNSRVTGTIAPAGHGLVVRFEDGSEFYVTITKVR